MTIRITNEKSVPLLYVSSDAAACTLAIPLEWTLNCVGELLRIFDVENPILSHHWWPIKRKLWPNLGFDVWNFLKGPNGDRNSKQFLLTISFNLVVKSSDRMGLRFFVSHPYFYTRFRSRKFSKTIKNRISEFEKDCFPKKTTLIPPRLEYEGNGTFYTIISVRLRNMSSKTDLQTSQRPGLFPISKNIGKVFVFYSRENF